MIQRSEVASEGGRLVTGGGEVAGPPSRSFALLNEPEEVEYYQDLLRQEPSNPSAAEGLRTACRNLMPANRPEDPLKCDLNIPDFRRPIRGMQLFEGWALSIDGVRRIEVLLDGVKRCDAVYGLPRPDVLRAYDAVESAKPCGFRFYLNTVPLANGTHELSLRLTTRAGAQDEIRLYLPVENEPLSAEEQDIVLQYCGSEGLALIDKSVFLPSYFSLETTVGCPSYCICARGSA